jgi:hypothetical protein
MAKLSKTRAFEKQLRELSSGSGKTLTTFRGKFSYEAPPSLLQQVQAALKPGISFEYEVPTRNEAEAYLVQEMVAVCSRLRRGLLKLAGDASQDSEGSAQPFTILVDETSPKFREKIFLEAQKIIRNTKLGINGRMRIYRALWTGDSIGQPIYTSLDNGKTWDLTDVWLMPTWEMHIDMKKGDWVQRKRDNIYYQEVGRWPLDYMVRNSHNYDHNHLYGRAALLDLLVSYRHYIAALEDLYVACRTRAPRRIVHYLGSEDGTWRVDKQALRDYKRRNELGSPKTIYTDYYLSAGFEKIDVLPGDAAGVRSLLDVVHMREGTMLEDLGLPVSMQDISGRTVSDSVDASYAATINTLRGEDNQFVVDVVKKGLRLKGYKDVDIDLCIPPLGETATLRWQRVWKAYEHREIDYYTACALIGQKNPFAMRKRIEEDLAWYNKHPEAYLLIGNPADKAYPGNPIPGTESAAKGGNSQMGKIRRNVSRQSGKPVATGA